VLRDLRAIGVLSDNDSLSRRRHEWRLIRGEATKVSGHEMKALYGSNSSRSDIDKGQGATRSECGSKSSA